MSKTLILMTALAPTTGHRDLIEFSANMPQNETFVLVNGRSFEPIDPALRTEALTEAFRFDPSVSVHLKINDNAPQNPEDHQDFWQWWVEEIKDAIPEVEQWDFVVASESYGLPLATALGATFMPFDLKRELNPVKSTTARLNHEEHWMEFLDTFRTTMALKVIMFGQESVGKSTFARMLADDLGGATFFEFARPYLEEVQSFVDERCMANIHRGQAALQRLSLKKAEKHLMIYDTDLFSTVGYWDIMKKSPPNELIEDAVELAGDVYYLLPDDIPVELDPIRFAGSERESAMGLWLDVLKRYDLPYVEVPPGTLEEKYEFISSDVLARLAERWGKVEAFERD